MNVIRTYIALAYGLSLALSLIIGLTGGHQSPLIGIGIVAMVIPALAVGIISLTMNERPRVDWHRFSLTYLPLALLLIPGVMHLAMLPTTALQEGGLPWQAWLSPHPDGLYHTSSQRGWGILTRGGLIARIATNALLGVVVVSFLAFFEEIGWRAWLLPRLIDRLGARRAIVITSIIWGIWHVPYVLSGIQQLDQVSMARAVLLIPLGSVFAGLVLGWLWVRTESIWLVSLAHGALNNWGQYAFKYMDFARANPSVVLGAGSLALLVVGSLLLGYGLPAIAKPGRRLAS